MTRPCRACDGTGEHRYLIGTRPDGYSRKRRRPRTWEATEPCPVCRGTGKQTDHTPASDDRGLTEEIRKRDDEIARLLKSETDLEAEVNRALAAIPSEFVGNDQWENGIIRMAAALAASRVRETK